MKRVIVVLVVLIVIAGLVGGGWWFLDENPEWLPWLRAEFDQAVAELGLDGEEPPPGLLAFGFVEAEEAAVTTELGGRIVALYADEGDEVTEGEVLVRLDDSLLLGQIEMAEAELAVAEAGLAQVRAGVQPETLDHARAQLQQAIAAREAARVAWEDSQAMLENPQELELAVTAARAQLGVLDFQEGQAQALANAAQTGLDFAETALHDIETFEPYDDWVSIGTYEIGELPPGIPLPPSLKNGEYEFRRYKVIIRDGRVEVFYLATFKVPTDVKLKAQHEKDAATFQAWEAWTGFAQAQTARSGAQSYLAELAAQQANPLALQAQVNAAESQFLIAASAVALAQAQVEGLQIGATPEQVAAVEAQVEVARAGLEALRVQLTKLMLEAPISGLVLERPVHVGEVALPGAPLLTLADLEKVTLTVYVPEDQLGQVQIGQPVSVTVDAYPGRAFLGRVAFIASQAEFTPQNVQTREERVNMVFAVKVRLPNPDHALKPGMPADAVILETGSEESS